MKLIDLPEKMRAKISLESAMGCWVWTGTTSPTGYPSLLWDGKSRRAHRVTYAMAYPGEDIHGLDVHHECGVRGCVNPEHLRAMTHRENLETDGILDVLRQARNQTSKTHCIHGHEFTEENTRITLEGWRACRKCRRRINREHSARERKKRRLANV